MDFPTNQSLSCRLRNSVPTQQDDKTTQILWLLESFNDERDTDPAPRRRRFMHRNDEVGDVSCFKYLPTPDQSSTGQGRLHRARLAIISSDQSPMKQLDPRFGSCRTFDIQPLRISYGVPHIDFFVGERDSECKRNHSLASVCAELERNSGSCIHAITQSRHKISSPRAEDIC